MATFTKLYGFVEHLAEGVHNFSSDSACTLTLALSNTAPSSEATRPDQLTANCVLANVTQISYTNLPTSRVLKVAASSQTSGTYKLVLSDASDNPYIVLTASGGSVGPFRYIYLYNDDPTSPADPLIAYWDYGAALTLASGETFTLNLSAANGVLTIA